MLLKINSNHFSTSSRSPTHIDKSYSVGFHGF